MRATRTLPPGYVLGGTIVLAKNATLMKWLAALSLPWTVVSFGVAAGLGQAIRPAGWHFTESVGLLVTILLGAVATVPVTLVLHEGIHGLVLLAITRSRPVFGFKGWYLYTDAPGWYVSRGQMLATLVAPFVVLPFVAVPFVAFAPSALSMLAMVGLIVNAIGAMGDLYLTVRVLRIRGPVVFGDAVDGEVGEAGSWFVPAEV